MTMHIKQTGEDKYFDVRLTMGEAIAILHSLEQGEYHRMSTGTLATNPGDLKAAADKIFRGYQIVYRDKSNALV